MISAGPGRPSARSGSHALGFVCAESAVTVVSAECDSALCVADRGAWTAKFVGAVVASCGLAINDGQGEHGKTDRGGSGNPQNMREHWHRCVSFFLLWSLLMRLVMRSAGSPRMMIFSERPAARARIRHAAGDLLEAAVLVYLRGLG